MGVLTEADVRRIVREETAALREWVGIDDPMAGSLRDALARLPDDLAAIRARFESVKPSVKGGDRGHQRPEGRPADDPASDDAAGPVVCGVDRGEHVIGDLAHAVEPTEGVA